MLTLYNAAHSTCSQKVRICLAEKELPFKDIRMDIGRAKEHLKPEYLQINPNGVVPTLVDDEKIIPDAAPDKHARRLLSALVAAALMAGCTSNPPNVANPDAVETGDGILVFRLSQNDRHGRVPLQRHLGLIAMYFDGSTSNPDEEIKVIKVSAGIYAFRALERLAQHYRLTPSVRFTAESKAVTYVGDFRVDWTAARVSVAVTDQEAATLGSARRLYPKMFAGDLPYRKAMASVE